MAWVLKTNPYKYKTVKQSAVIREYLNRNKNVLQISKIEQFAGVYDKCLTNFLKRENNCLSKENIQKLIPVLRNLGFEMLSVSADVNDIIYTVCKLSQIPFDMIKSKTQRHHIIEEKQILIYLVQKLTSEKQANIAKTFECTDSNISLAIKRITGLIEVDPRIQKKVNWYETELRKNL